MKTKGGIRLLHLLLPVLHGGSGMKTGGAHNLFSKFLVARSFTADGNLLQPTECEQNTSHFTLFSCLRARVTICHTTSAQVFVRVISSMFHAPVCLIALRPSLRTLPLSLPSSTYPPDLLLHVPCGCCRSKIPCALRRMRSLAFWSTTPLSQVMSPTSSMTTTSQRPLTFSSRSPPAKASPQTCMSWRSMTAPSAERSLHHCSLRSEKNQRAVDKLITRLKKVCCQVSRCLSVM